MKKVIFSLAILGLVFASSCKKDDDNDEPSCESLLTTINETSEAFNEDDTSVNCISYTTAIRAFIDSDCGTEVQDAQFEAVLEFAGC